MNSLRVHEFMSWRCQVWQMEDSASESLELKHVIHVLESQAIELSEKC
jgi:hypothetical protein